MIIELCICLTEKVIAVQQTLVNCNIKVCEERHVPILLGAYGASMSAVDQRILKVSKMLDFL